jgi:signal transduction histidine kinase
VVVDVEEDGIKAVWLIERLRRQDNRCPIFLFAGARSSDWEEEAYLRGVTQVLNKPVRPRILAALLDRSLAVEVNPPLPPPVRREVSPAPAPVSTGTAGALGQPLAVLRNFSSILTHSLNADALLHQFLRQLRDIIGLNRAAIFLRPGPDAAAGLTASPNRLHPVSAIGIAPGLLEHFELSLESGLGGQVNRVGRIVRRQSEEVAYDSEAQKEFDLLGTQVAVPMFDREALLGIALLDGRITGEALTNSELELVFHLLEQVGLGIRNIWLHDQLTANSEMMGRVLRELNSACVVVGADLRIRHANKMARKYFPRAVGGSGELEFRQLPPPLGGKICQVLQSGTAMAPFRYEPEGAPGASYSVMLVPFPEPPNPAANSVLMVVDDLTQSEQLRQLEVETANLRLIRLMADRLTHEVGNAMVPISTYQQLFREKYRDSEFRASFEVVLAEGVKRVNRLINQMRFLARDAVATNESIPLVTLLEEAYREAQSYLPGKAGPLKLDSSSKTLSVQGDRAALRCALAEVMINALQANPTDPRVGVRCETASSDSGATDLQIEVYDNGQGFTAEAQQKAFAPFYGTRNVGLGLGLTVTRKIVETHRGKLEILPPASERAGVVRISLPVEKKPAADAKNRA